MLLTVLSIFDTKVSKRLSISLGSKPDWKPSGILTRNHSIQLKHKNPLSYSPQVLIKLSLAIRLFQKKSKQEGNSRQNEASPWKFHKIVLYPLEFPRPETKTFGNFTWFFLVYPWNIHILFFQYPWQLHVLSPLVWIFSEIVHSRNCFV